MFENEPLQEATIDCPYCGAQFSALIDYSAGESNYIEDCAVCCQPIEFYLRAQHDGELQLSVLREDEIY
ncbi:MAG: hypothetical protein JWM78_1885 [Verrucomicrobiaceae bacterium]|nr:hypothetical protein [Verrucomicrobiaceae bacterium]